MLNTKGRINLDYKLLEKSIKTILEQIGEDPDREGLKSTPLRVAKSYEFLTQGYTKNVEEIVNGAIFNEKYDEMVIVKDIDFYSMCEHHLLPFFGKVHISYIPNGKIIGLSKIPRLVDMYSRRLQIQERMTQEIAETIQSCLHPRGVGVVVEAYHMCKMMRGVQKQNTNTITSAMLGTFKADARTRSEFLDLISHKRI
jgi:GTP cyclohydrolase I